MLSPNELRFLSNIAADRLAIAYRIVGCGMTPESVKDVSAIVVRCNELAAKIESEAVEAQKKAKDESEKKNPFAPADGEARICSAPC